MSKASDPVRIAVTIIVGGMTTIVAAGALTLAVLSPELLGQAWNDVAAGDDRGGAWLWGAQATIFLGVVAGLLGFVWTRRAVK